MDANEHKESADTHRDHRCLKLLAAVGPGKGYNPEAIEQVAAGADCAPDHSKQLLVNCVFRNCVFENNAGHGMFVRAHDRVADGSPPISIRFENCKVRMTGAGTGGDSGMCVRVPGDAGPSGTIEFINCLTENTGQAGANIYGLSIGHYPDNHRGIEGAILAEQ